MMDDVIYRQDAAKILCNLCGVCPEDKRDIMKCEDICPEFAKIPSAQQWIPPRRCIDCENFNKTQLLVPQAQQKWIPCEKKMPKAEEKVWIQTQSGEACFAMYEDGTILENDSKWSWFDIEYSSWDEDEDCGIIPEGWWEFTVFHPDCEFDCPVDEKVVAWMPLPEPYKEGENG